LFLNIILSVLSIYKNYVNDFIIILQERIFIIEHY